MSRGDRYRLVRALLFVEASRETPVIAETEILV